MVRLKVQGREESNRGKRAYKHTTEGLDKVREELGEAEMEFALKDRTALRSTVLPKRRDYWNLVRSHKAVHEYSGR